MLGYQDMPAHSRVWIYQTDRQLKDLEIEEIRRKAAMFLIDWTSHGHLMKATIDVLYNRFIVVLADEKAAAASGCGIDKSVRFIRQLETDYNLNLFDRLLVTYRDQEGTIQSTKLQLFEQLVSNGTLNESTIVFNNLVATKAEMDANWEVSLQNSWHARMLVF
jgi:hypothetical protein